MVIGNNGFLGLGISVPESKLHLYNGNFTITTGSINLTDGNILIYDGTTLNYKVDKTGLVYARELKVKLGTIPPDYVFNSKYKLMSIQELETFIKNYNHLPNIPSATEITKDGSINVGEFQMKLLEKVEELTLYMIEIKKENIALKDRIKILETKVK